MKTSQWFFLVMSLGGAHASQAGSATWNPNPTSNDWNTAANWTPATVPDGPADLATFDGSNITGIALSEDTAVNGLVYASSASAFTITVNPTLTWTLSGSGISNNSQVMQEVVAASAQEGQGEIDFTGNATAGAMTDFTAQGGMGDGQEGGLIYFKDNASAATGNFITEAPFTEMSAFGGAIFFEDNATAGNGHFTNFGSISVHRDSAYGSTSFFGNSTAAHGVFLNKPDNANGGSGGQTSFHDQSTADQGTFTNDGAGLSYGASALTSFFNNSSAGHGTFTNKPAVRRYTSVSGGTVFYDSSTASEGTLLALGATVFTNRGGFVEFRGNATAGDAGFTVTSGANEAQGGSISFLDASDGGTAKIDVSGNGFVDLSLHDAPGITIGSINGDGFFYLGANTFEVGSDNISTTFSGIIQDGGGQGGGTGGSMTKIGTGTLTLSNVNTYTGGTTIEAGVLLVKTGPGSATGTGAVQVNTGTFGGRSNILGAVTVGTGSGSGSYLAPGLSGPGTLVIKGAVTFKTDGTYNCDLSTGKVKADQVKARKVTIENGAQFALLVKGNNPLPTGTVFTVINSTSPNPISGTFANLADGSTVTANGNSFHVSYEGGDGNDLTLTILP